MLRINVHQIIKSKINVKTNMMHWMIKLKYNNTLSVFIEKNNIVIYYNLTYYIIVCCAKLNLYLI